MDENDNNNNNDDDDDDLVVTNETYPLFYRIFRPQSLSPHHRRRPTTTTPPPPSLKTTTILLPKSPPPLLVLHGGPGVPSDYLYPLVDYVPFRSILFYDQIGCGRSFQPRDVAAYSLSYAVDDLEQFLKSLNITHCHIYGHSFGGLLAFEYLKRLAIRRRRARSSSSSSSSSSDVIRCLSVTLSSTPTSISTVTNESRRLLFDDDECRGDARLFHSRHCCRQSTAGRSTTPSSSSLTEDLPPPLREAYVHAGRVWRGTAAVAGYEASWLRDDEEEERQDAVGNDDDRLNDERRRRRPSSLPPALIMRGEYDFVTDACVEGWKTIWGADRDEEEEDDGGGGVVEMVTLEGCSHYGLLENGSLYGRHLNNFLKRFDDDS